MIKFKDILEEEKILVPRHLETRDEEYKRIFYKKIQDYIKGGSKGNLNLFQVPITKLPDNFVKVGGILNLSNSKIQSLSNLKVVEKSLNLWGTSIKSLGNIQKIGNILYLSNSLVESLGNLQFVGWSLEAYDSQLKSLGNLKFVGKNLYLENTPLSRKYSRKEIFQMVKDKGIEVKGKIFI